MKKFLSALSIAILAMGACAPLAAQTHVVPVYSYPSPGTPPGVILQCDANADNCTPTTAANPLAVTTSSGTGTLAGQVQGNVASGAADLGNPVKAGCIFNTTPPTVTAGQRVDAQCSNRGEQLVTLSVAGAALSTSIPTTDTQTASGVTGLSTRTYLMLYNGATWARAGTIIASDGLGTNVAGVANAPTSAAAGALVPVVSTTLESCHVMKASGGNLYSLAVTIQATTGIVQVFNQTAAPADGAVTPIWSMPVISNGTLGGASWDFTGMPLRGGTGLTVCFSSATTPFTKTASATALISGQVQ